MMNSAFASAIISKHPARVLQLVDDLPFDLKRQQGQAVSFTREHIILLDFTASCINRRIPAKVATKLATELKPHLQMLFVDESFNLFFAVTNDPAAPKDFTYCMTESQTEATSIIADVPTCVLINCRQLVRATLIKIARQQKARANG